MALVIRNTFLDFSNDTNQDCSSTSVGRSSSAPPTCRQETQDKGDFHSAAILADVSTDASSDEDEVTSQSSNTAHEDASPAMSEAGSDSECDSSRTPKLSDADAEKQLELMSQSVMDIWAKLRAIESSIEAEPAEPEKEAVEVPLAPAKGQALHGSARPFVPSGQVSEMHSLLLSVKQALAPVQGVAAVDVTIGPVGTLSTISIRLQASFARRTQTDGVIAIAKSTLFELAASSESVYVVGYDSQKPFEEDAHGFGFYATMATMPSECTACWDLYQHGCCPRRKTCKWQHPGRNELQPVRIVIC